MTLSIIAITLLIVSAIAEAIMDKLQFHFDDSVFHRLRWNKWWDPTISWMNKWKRGDPSNGEAFPGSSTVFCFVTDAWHFFQFIQLRSLIGSVILFSTTVIMSFIDWRDWVKYIIAYVVLSIIFSGTFELFFSIIFKKRAK
jgi:hypothetical protein